MTKGDTDGRPEQIYRLNPEREARFGLSAMVRFGNTLHVAGLLSVDDVLAGLTRQGTATAGVDVPN